MGPAALILHPFNERVPALYLLENSKAALMLSGLNSSDGSDQRRLKAPSSKPAGMGEVRMLFFLGKECVPLIEVHRMGGTHSDCMMLNRGAQFCRPAYGQSANRCKREADAVGGIRLRIHLFACHCLNTMFAGLRSSTAWPRSFSATYHRYADSCTGCYMESQPHGQIASKTFALTCMTLGSTRECSDRVGGQRGPRPGVTLL